ncbi:glycosyltransferase family 2 protein [Mycoplasma mycoides subsp. capri]|uniref:glycosyltransferase family A protein n=1 Tax=Mycoplasma mycoides TaxID=2102 RepID=UPI00223FA759|nr:glycosyltransferase family A protein [Mycoplasma mycoides]UZK64472.1 glycosyltransferase family 2 protein [Mycoplasma mycoides subsp. capri]
MLVSFIIASQAHLDRLKTTVDSIKHQTNSSHQTIIISDSKYTDNTKRQYIKEIFDNSESIVLSENNIPQDTATDWNCAMQLANGKYVVFVKEGDFLYPNFVEEIQKISDKHNADLVEFNQNYNGLVDDQISYNLLEANKLYDLNKDYEVFAYIQRLIYTKAFKLDIIRKNNLTFRRKVRFDHLFTYKFLSYSNTCYISDDYLSLHRISVMKYSAFDLLRQWPHIINYFRQINKYKLLSDQLTYAHYYQTCYKFLDLIEKYNNPVLYKKALNITENKLKTKINRFIKKNKVFLENKDTKFNQRMNDFERFIYSELKKIK